MPSKKENLRLISDLIELAKSEDGVDAIEKQFLIVLALRLGVTEKEVEALMETPSLERLPKSEADRIIQFHRLLLLMNVDQNTADSEKNKIKDLGIKMGLNPIAIYKALNEMHKYENNMLPPEKMMEIFKVSFN